MRRDSEQVDFIDVGLSIEVTAREGAAGHALIETSVTLSEEVASVAAVPVVSEQVLKSRASVQNDVVSLLGSLARSRQEGIVSALFTWGDNRAQDQELLQVWCRVYSVE